MADQVEDVVDYAGDALEFIEAKQRREGGVLPHGLTADEGASSQPLHQRCTMREVHGCARLCFQARSHRQQTNDTLHSQSNDTLHACSRITSSTQPQSNDTLHACSPLTLCRHFPSQVSIDCDCSTCTGTGAVSQKNKKTAAEGSCSA
eukprot:COSAG01_NODE_2457_length_7657_cov_13.869410_2_plen_148_part_00